MRQKSVHPESPSERIVKNIRRATRKRHSAEEKIRIVLDGLRGKSSIAELCRREGIAESLYYAWSKEFLEAGKRRLAGDTARAATNGEVKDLRREAQELKAVVAEQALELRMISSFSEAGYPLLVSPIRDHAFFKQASCKRGARWSIACCPATSDAYSWSVSPSVAAPTVRSLLITSCTNCAGARRRTGASVLNGLQTLSRTVKP